MESSLWPSTFLFHTTKQQKHANSTNIKETHLRFLHCFPTFAGYHTDSNCDNAYLGLPDVFAA